MIDILLIITMIVGIALIVVSFKMSTKKEVTHEPTTDYLEVENTIRAVDKSIIEADNAIENLNKISESVFTEFEQKYQEILFLYSLIDEKKKEIAEIYNKPIPAAGNSESEANEDDESDTDEAQTKTSSAAPIKNPYYDEIVKLSEEGMSMTEIAKTLDMGQGEVKLIFELGKDR